MPPWSVRPKHGERYVPERQQNGTLIRIIIIVVMILSLGLSLFGSLLLSHSDFSPLDCDVVVLLNRSPKPFRPSRQILPCPNRPGLGPSKNKHPKNPKTTQTPKRLPHLRVLPKQHLLATLLQLQLRLSTLKNLMVPSHVMPRA